MKKKRRKNEDLIMNLKLVNMPYFGPVLGIFLTGVAKPLPRFTSKHSVR